MFFHLLYFRYSEVLPILLLIFLKIYCLVFISSKKFFWNIVWHYFWRNWSILAVSYIELSSDETKKSIEIYENQKKILNKISMIEESVKDTEKSNIDNKTSIESIKLSQEKL